MQIQGEQQNVNSSLSVGGWDKKNEWVGRNCYCSFVENNR